MIKKLLNAKTIIFTILAIAILFLIPKITGLLLLLFASYVIAAALNPFVNNLEKKVKKRPLAASIVLLITMIIVLALLMPLIVMGVKEIQLLFAIMPEKVLELYNTITNYHLFGQSVTELLPLDGLLSSSTDVAHNIVNQSINITMAIGGACFILIALSMFVYYVIVDKNYFKSKFLEFFPPNMKDKAELILRNITEKVGSYVRAQIISMVAVGLMITFVTAILGIDYPILLGLIAGILDIIPILGPSIALGIILIIAYPLGLVKIILAVALFLTAQQVSNYVIRPFLFGKFMKLHPITIMVSILIAQEFLGIWGIILSPAIAATICVLFDELYLTPINAKEVPVE